MKFWRSRGLTLGEADSFNTKPLWDAAERLTGYSYTGEFSINPPVLLRDAAREIERLQDLLVEAMRDPKSEGQGEKAGTQTGPVGLHQPHPVQEKPGTGLPSGRYQ